MIVFNGIDRAAEIEQDLKKQVEMLVEEGKRVHIAAVLFEEDEGSVLYTRLKKEAAERVGIGYEVTTFPMLATTESVMNHVRQLSEDPAITGIIIQKPWRKTWAKASMLEGEEKAIKSAFNTWWSLITSQIVLEKDVDGLNPHTLHQIESGTWKEEGRVMPATARAVLDILEQASQELNKQSSEEWLEDKKVIILGQSDILGKPLFFELKNRGVVVEIMGSAGLRRRQDQGKFLHDADVVISATGHHNLVTGDLLKDGVVLIDVGEPRPDIDAASVQDKAAFLTPVPGGVGPMTVVSLLRNAVDMV